MVRTTRATRGTPTELDTLLVKIGKCVMFVHDFHKNAHAGRIGHTNTIIYGAAQFTELNIGGFFVVGSECLAGFNPSTLPSSVFSLVLLLNTSLSTHSDHK